MSPDSLHELRYITKAMLEQASANIPGMQLDSVMKLDRFAEKMMDDGFKVTLVFNGCNSGEHLSPEHASGQAIDFAFDGSVPPVWRVVCALAYEGFKAIGVYINQARIFSFHADPVRYRQWGRWKDKAGIWHEVSLLTDMEKFIKG